jgi:iron complex outermembrane recepter protein
MPKIISIVQIMFFVIIVSVSVVSGAEKEQSADTLTELSLESLLNVSVVSASRKSQILGDVTSAVFVINQEDIRRSGATTIPDLLRMVPGVQVASVDGNSWAVSIRGFNGNFANKLLVMIDGRSIYTPLYGGVFWDVQDPVLDNIERIEVIRGSGGTMWGANAVNGVINIITKSSHDTKGGLLSGLTGSYERGTVEARYGATIGNDTSYRLYVKHAYRDDTFASTGTASDSLRITRGGFRSDSTLPHNVNLTLQGDMYGGEANNTFTGVSFPSSFTVSEPAKLFGGNILSRLDWLQSESSQFSFQLYYDRTGRDITIFKENRDTVDIDLQHNLRVAQNHDITWGAGYRYLHDQTTDKNRGFSVKPDNRTDNLMNLFIQDEITLLPETLRFIVGSKFEHNDYTGWELQPSARLLWIPQKGYSVWAAVTRSVRTPSRAEQDVTINLAVIPPSTAMPLPSVVVVSGDRQTKAESLVSYELGLRADLTAALSLDITAFYNQYHDIINTQQRAPFVQGGTQVIVPYKFTNDKDYQSCGGELSLQWQPLEWWKIKGGYAYINFYGDDVDNSMPARATPTHQTTLRSMLSFGRNVDFDLWGRYVGATRYPLITETVDIPVYFTLDTRLAWRPTAGVELSIVGKNLLDKRHLETATDLTVVRHEMERSVYGKVTWAF